MNMMKPALALALVLAVPAASPAVNCGAATKELAKLRQEYKTYIAASTKAGGVNFDELVKILDKIITLKDEMRSNCKIPPRSR